MTNPSINRRPFSGSFTNMVDDLLTELPVLFKNEFNSTVRKGFAPVNVKETGNGYQLEVVAPGFGKTDFKVNLDQQVLTISAERKNETIEGVKEIRREHQFSSFKRSFTLDEKIDATNIEASYINGVLLLNLPKKEAVKAAATEIVIK